MQTTEQHSNNKGDAQMTTVGLITYHFPHLKTEQVLQKLLQKRRHEDTGTVLLSLKQWGRSLLLLEA